MKLRLGLLNKDLAYRFDVGDYIISKIFRNWVKPLAASLQNLMVWPDRGIIRQNMPASFKKKYKDCVCIITPYNVVSYMYVIFIHICHIIVRIRFIIVHVWIRPKKKYVCLGLPDRA